MRTGHSVATRKLFHIALNCQLMNRVIGFDNSYIISRAQRNLGYGAFGFRRTQIPIILPNSCLVRRWPRKADSATALGQSSLHW